LAARVSSIYGAFVDLPTRLDTVENTVATQLAEITNKTVNVKTYGAIGDNINDDTQSIKNAVFACEIGDTLLIPKAVSYKTTETIVIPASINVTMESDICYHGVTDEPILVVGEPNVINYAPNLFLSVLRNELSDWMSEESIGIRLINLQTADNVTIHKANLNTVGVEFVGDGKGFSYNTIIMGMFDRNKKQVVLTSRNTGGYANENLFIGGRFTNLSSPHLDKNRYGIVITGESTNYCNNNVFIKPSIELITGELVAGVEAIPIIFEKARENLFISARNESNTGIFARALNDSSNNELDVGYGSAEIEELGNYPTTVASFRKNNHVDAQQNLLFKTDNIHKKACVIDTTGRINIPGLGVANTSYAGLPSRNSSLIINPNYLEIPANRGIGLKVDTSVVKDYVVKVDSESETDPTYGGTLNIQCYDINGVLLTNTSGQHPYVKGTNAQTPFYNTSYEGVYRISASNQPKYFVVGADVKKIDLIIGGGTVTRIRGFAIYTKNHEPATVASPYYEPIPGVNVGTSPPLVGTWEVGRRIINVVPTVGAPKSWVCTVEGTPGTWISEGNL